MGTQMRLTRGVGGYVALWPWPVGGWGYLAAS